MERYIGNHFYENVNSPPWRERLRASLGFCHEHAWLGINQRLGDALGYSIIYHDMLNTILNLLNDDEKPSLPSRSWMSLFGPVSEQVRMMIEKMLYAFTPRKRCPVCEHRDEITRATLSELVKELKTPAMATALQASEGLCLLHLRQALEYVKNRSTCEKLLTIHREKLEGLRAELAEFIRKNDYQLIQAGFGKEGDAWLRTVRMIAGTPQKA